MHSGRTALAISTLAALASAGATGVASATAPARNGQVAFVRIRLDDSAGTSDVFVANADGSRERQLTQAPAGYRDGQPDWVRGGTRVLFQRCAPDGGTCLVWSVSPATGRSWRLSAACRTGGPCSDDRSPVSSPDGRRIAFVRSAGKPGSRPLLMVADASLRHARAVAGLGRLRLSPYAAAWSPGGGQLAVAGLDGAGRRALWVVGVDGSRLRRVTPWSLQAGDRPDWSPDGTRILFRSQSNREGAFGANLYTVRPDGTGLRQVTHVQPSYRVLAGSYSPDGTSIVLSTTAAATAPTLGLPDVFVARSDGTGMRPVTRSPSWDAAPDWGPRR